MNINIAICDDEVSYTDKLKSGIEKALKEKEVSSYRIDVWNSGEEMCRNKEKLLEYQVVFLDMQMKEMSGLETAQEVRRVNKTCCLVFVTAFIEYAPEGYRLEVIRYLLKKDLDGTLPECVETVLEKINRNNRKESFGFKEGEKELPITEILYVESEKHRLIFHLAGGKEQCFTMAGRLDDIQKRLEQYGFIRVHKSFLVNLEKITLIKNYKVKLENGEELPVPREKFRQVKKLYMEMEARV